MSKARSGYPWYGQKVGILVFKGEAPRIPGDPGHAETFPYSVRYAVVEGKFLDLVEGSPTIKANLVQALKELRSAGVEGAVGDCGLMSLYQDELATLSGLPFMGSSLALIPLVWYIIGCSGSIGIITGHSELLLESHLLHSGWRPEISLAIQGMEHESHFAEIVINGGKNLDPTLMSNDVVSAAKKLLSAHPEVRAIILECSNLATFSQAVYEETKLPVFDIVAAANLLEYALNPPQYL